MSTSLIFKFPHFSSMTSDFEIDSQGILRSFSNAVDPEIIRLFLKLGKRIDPETLGDGLFVMDSQTFSDPIVFGQDRVGRWFLSMHFKWRKPESVKMPDHFDELESAKVLQSAKKYFDNPILTAIIAQRGHSGQPLDGFGVWICFQPESFDYKQCSVYQFSDAFDFSFRRYGSGHDSLFKHLLNGTHPTLEICPGFQHEE